MLSFITVFFPIVSGFVLLNLKNKAKKYSIFVVATTVALTILTNLTQINQEFAFLKLPFGLDFSFKVDMLSILFSTLASVVWLIVLVYSFEYMAHKKDRTRYFSFYSMVLGAVLGVCYANDMLTLYMFFELMTVMSYVLVVHDRTNTSMLAGRKFLYFSIFGASLGLIGIVYLMTNVSDISFVLGGISEISSLDIDGVLTLTFIAIIGFSSKAGMFPLHSWLPPTYNESEVPVSAILAGIIKKCGVIAIIRIIYFVVGPNILQVTWVQYTLLTLSLLTIFMGSMLAFREKGLKRRLSYSSISQVSYILFGVFLLTPSGVVGGLLQVIFHALAKTALFLTVGVLIQKTGKSNVEDVEGIGSKMPKTFTMFTIAAMSLVGIPLTSGFVSKWYLARGAVEFEGIIGIIVIMISAVLTGGYLLTVSYSAFFAVYMAKGLNDGSKMLLVPIGILCAFIVIFGIYPLPLIEYISAIFGI